MRCGKLDYNNKTGEFNVPRVRRKHVSISEVLSALWSGCKRITRKLFDWMIFPWIWWWTKERDYWRRHQWGRVAAWILVGLVLLKAYQFALLILLKGVGSAYVCMAYAVRFIVAAFVWAWEVLCECCRWFVPWVRQGWQWFWTVGEDVLR